MTEVREGKLTIDEAGHRLFYRLFGKGDNTIIALHGGPGVSHRYLTRLAELAGEGVQLLLYDQLGAGHSDRPDDPSLWTVTRFVEELDTVRKHFDFGRVHLLGQSWGGMLALQYTLDHPEGVKSLIVSNAGASNVEIIKGIQQRRMELPTDVYREMLKYEGAGDYENPEYKDLMCEFNARFVRRSTPFEAEESIKGWKDVAAMLRPVGPPYYTMWGPNESVCTGALIDWDVTERLSEIGVPTLLLCGWYDECIPGLHRTMADRIPDNEFVIFGNSSHLTILEKEADSYLAVIREFVRRVNSRT